MRALKEKINNHIYFKDFIFIFREREGEREGEKHQHVVASHVPPTRDPACNLGTRPDQEPNRFGSQPFSSQASTQSTGPHQPGQ